MTSGRCRRWSGIALPPVRDAALEAICLPVSFHMGSPSATGAVPPPGPPSRSPAHKGTLSPLNDKQFCDAEAGKRIRQVQGSLENRCVRGAAIWGQVNSWGEHTRNANNGLGGSERAGGRGGAPGSAPLLLSHHTHRLQLRQGRSLLPANLGLWSCDHGSAEEQGHTDTASKLQTHLKEATSLPSQDKVQKAFVGKVGEKPLYPEGTAALHCWYVPNTTLAGFGGAQ